MSTDSKFYLHKSDKAALKALKAIPGFSKLMKGFMSVMYERQYRISNMATNVRINENQLSEYYNMLPPICEKLGIEVPELYLDIDPYPNAYTYGDTQPFIVITSGLIETIPHELIPTVLAHECGHIACHHTLYTTMGNLLLNGSDLALSRLPFGSFISLSLQVAFFYWMRCSEFSADRAAAIVDGSADKMTEVCMRLAGFDKDIEFSANKEEFMKQAVEYREMMTDSKWNKTLEFFILFNKTHPLAAVRALEIQEWSESNTFKKILDGSITDEDVEEDDEIEPDDENDEVAEQKKTKFELPKFLKKASKENSDITSEQNAAFIASEIREYKALLDEGLITQEEFDAKKKELLG